MHEKSTVLYPALPAFSIDAYPIDGAFPAVKGRVILFLAHKPCKLFLIKQVFSLAEGDLLWIPPFSLCYALSDFAIYGVAFALPEDILAAALPGLSLPDGGKFLPAIGDAEKLKIIFDNFTKKSDRRYTDLIAILSILESSHYPDMEVSMPLPRLLQRVLSYLQDHPAERISAEALARRYAISKSTLSRALRTHLNTGFLALHSAIRIKEAEKLLFFGISKEEAARRCGFSSVKALDAAFKKTSGISLKEYLRK